MVSNKRKQEVRLKIAFEQLEGAIQSLPQSRPSGLEIRSTRRSSGQFELRRGTRISSARFSSRCGSLLSVYSKPLRDRCGNNLHLLIPYLKKEVSCAPEILRSDCAESVLFGLLELFLLNLNG